MHTKDKLAQALGDAGLHDMAARASQGWYHDFMSPLEAPVMQLAHDLHEAGTPEARALRLRVVNGEFDATKEEADAWAASPEGQEIFGRLKGGR